MIYAKPTIMVWVKISYAILIVLYKVLKRVIES